MNTFTRIVCLTIIVTALVFVAFKIPIKSQTVRFNDFTTDKASRISGDDFSFSTQTPKGVIIKAVKKPSRKLLKAIDKGFDDLFKIAESSNYRYRRQLNHSNYTIYIAAADRLKNAAGDYSADLAIGSAQYAGTKYDQGGYIYVAGIVVGYNPNAFMLAEHTSDFERVSEIVRYEGEHLVLYHNDRRLYEETADHSRGGGHPILHLY